MEKLRARVGVLYISVIIIYYSFIVFKCTFTNQISFRIKIVPYIYFI